MGKAWSLEGGGVDCINFFFVSCIVLESNVLSVSACLEGRLACIFDWGSRNLLLFAYQTFKLSIFFPMGKRGRSEANSNSAWRPLEIFRRLLQMEESQPNQQGCNANWKLSRDIHLDRVHVRHWIVMLNRHLQANFDVNFIPTSLWQTFQHLVGIC